MGRLVVVSNRVPAMRDRTQLAGGLAIGLKDAIAERKTLWFGWSGNRRGEHDPPPAPQVTTTGDLTFATIDLTHRQYAGFYEGFANATLWPLFHSRVGLADFRREDLAVYRDVNRFFAEQLKPLLAADDMIWVHDYHLIPMGDALRRLGLGNRLGFFLHIPFPPPPIFETLPQGESLLRAFDAYDVIGVQTEGDANCLNQAMTQMGIAGRAAAYPIGIDPDGFAAAAARADNGGEVHRLEESLAGRALILGVDRLDYSKGIPQRFRGFAQLLRRFPEHRNRVTFLQIAPVSRGEVTQYRRLRRELDEMAGHINGEQAEFDWMPLRYITRPIARDTLAGFHRRARVGLITPLRDGMNLVAKEYVAAQDPDDPGVLVLSRFAGAAAELRGGAILINPYDPDEIAEAVDAALRLPLGERRDRWRQMNEAIHRSTAAVWARTFLAALDPGDRAIGRDAAEI